MNATQITIIILGVIALIIAYFRLIRGHLYTQSWLPLVTVLAIIIIGMLIYTATIGMFALGVAFSLYILLGGGLGYLVQRLVTKHKK